jgi:hypothetical protein
MEFTVQVFVRADSATLFSVAFPVPDTPQSFYLSPGGIVKKKFALAANR